MSSYSCENSRLQLHLLALFSGFRKSSKWQETLANHRSARWLIVEPLSHHLCNLTTFEWDSTVNLISPESLTSCLNQEISNQIICKQDKTKPTFNTVLDFMLYYMPQTQWDGTEVQYPAALGDLFVFRQQTRPELSDSPDIMIYGRPRLPTLDRTKLRQDRDYYVLQVQWSKGTPCSYAFNSISNL